MVLLFLHYFGGSAHEWQHVTAKLNGAYRCVAADMPGFGDSADVGGYTVAEMCSQVESLIAHFAPAPVVLIGHSMGGKVAMVVAANPPENLQRVILVGPSPLVPEPIAPDARATMILANATRASAEIFVKNGAHRTLSEEDLATGIADVQRANPEAWRTWPQRGTLEDWSGRIKLLKVRADLIVGELDEAIPLPFQRQHTLPIVEASGGGLTVIEDAAHMLPYEAAAELAEAIKTILR